MEQDSLLNQLPEPLLIWYNEHKRILPWRDPIVPYHTWISEIMLQQTRVDTVIDYYNRFLNALPTIQALAEASEEQLLKLWEGLGYYNRVRNLQKAAQILVESYQGELPADHEALKKLPGIGSYTAGAIGAIAFSLPTPAVDGNVLRVATRITGSRENISKQKTKEKYEDLFRKMLENQISSDQRGELVQSLMELGALVCVPNGAPKCQECPAKNFCQARIQDIWDEIPVKDEKKNRKIEEKTVLILRCGSEFALHQRPKKGLLAGLWELPMIEGFHTEDEIRQVLEARALHPLEIRTLGSAKHLFSHIEWKMTGILVTLSDWPDNPALQKVSTAELEQNYALPSAFDAFRPWLNDKS